MGTTTTTTVSTTTLESVVEKIIESDNEIDDAAEIEQHDENTEHEEHDNDKNCHKCHKASFKYRKDLFCDKCIKKGLVNLEKDVGKKPHCKKCKKSKFRIKNGDFCKMKWMKKLLRTTQLQKLLKKQQTVNTGWVHLGAF